MTSRVKLSSFFRDSVQRKVHAFNGICEDRRPFGNLCSHPLEPGRSDPDSRLYRMTV